jgi:integrase
VIEKTPNGRFRARLKSGRQFVASRTFDTKREASDWLARERAALAGGVDPRTGRRLVRALLEEWLAIREFTVAAKTYRTDRALQRLVPTSMQAMQVAAVSERDVARSFEALIQHGLSERSVVRYRASLSSFFAWCVREKIIVRNPVTGTKVPRSSEEPTEMRPWTEAELEAAYDG